MNQKILKKYAKFLVKDCLKVKNGQPLLIVGSKVIESFANIVKEEAEKLNIGEVFLLLKDSFAERKMFLTKSYEECIKSPLLDRSLYNLIAEKNGTILNLNSPIPHINDGVSPELLQKLAVEMERRIPKFREKQRKGELPWCIAAVANPYWAKEILPNEIHAERTLWESIFNICYIYEDDPGAIWEQYFDTLKCRCDLLNEMKIHSLHYKGSNGTDITFELPEDYIFASAKDHDYVCNMPSLELFTTPKKDGVNGIVYSSKPLFYNGIKINDFYLRFEKGRIVEASAKENNDYLQRLIETDEGSHYLGEVSFVDFDSKINQSGILFEMTLYDENACCHLAIGKGFSECFVDGPNKSLDELKSMGMNHSLVHVDFMIGTKDLNITATLKNGEEKVLMQEGKLVF